MIRKKEEVQETFEKKTRHIESRSSVFGSRESPKATSKRQLISQGHGGRVIAVHPS